MSDIRKYIDLVEGFGVQPQRTFGRKGTEIPKITPTQDQLEEIERCRQFPTAEKYADQYNKYGRTYNTDPPHIKRWAADEQEALMARWNHWKHMNYL